MCGLWFPEKALCLIPIIYCLAKGAVQIGLAIGILVNVGKVEGVFASNQNRIDTLSLVNGCSDAFTKINSAYYSEQIAEAKDQGGSLPGMALTVLIAAICSVIALAGAVVAKLTK